MYLVFVRYVGETFDSTRIYEFLFSKDKEQTFQIGWENYNWDSQPANNRPQAFKETIDLVGTINTDKIKFDIITNSMEFDMLDCKEGVIALAWENVLGYDETTYPEERMVFNYGMEKGVFDDLLYAREIKINYK